VNCLQLLGHAGVQEAEHSLQKQRQLPNESKTSETKAKQVEQKQ
jgi:hypothetical protein